jgi:hypothetical protein
MDARQPRMYGKCRECGDVLMHILPLRSSFTDLSVSDQTLIGYSEKTLKDQPLRQTAWKASNDPVRFTATLVQEISQRVFERLERHIDEREAKARRALRNQELEFAALDAEMSKDVTHLERAISKLEYRIARIIEDAESSIYRALQQARFQHPLPETPPDSLPVICDERHFSPTIYGLVDRLDINRIRYVGQTLTPGTRYATHVGKTAAPRVQEWVRSLGEAGPLMVLVETPHRLELDDRERFWIHYYRERGMADLNTSVRT